MRGIHIYNQVTTDALESVVKKGIALVWWSYQHVSRSTETPAIGRLLLDLAKNNQLDFAALHTIRTAMVCMFEGVWFGTKIEVIKFTRLDMVSCCIPVDGQDFN